MKIKRSEGSIVADVIIYSITILYALITLLPMLYVLMQSFATNAAVLIPKSFSLDTYQYVFSNKSLIRSMGVSFYITILGTFLSMLVTCLMAYA